MQVHYHKTGRPEEDQTKLALYFAKEPIRKEMKLLWMMIWTYAFPRATSIMSNRTMSRWTTT